MPDPTIIPTPLLFGTGEYILLSYLMRYFSLTFLHFHSCRNRKIISTHTHSKKQQQQQQNKTTATTKLIATL